MKKSKFHFYRQLDYRDCGSTCLRMIAKHHGKIFSREFLRDKSGITRMGVTMAGIADAAEAIEMRTLGVRVSLDSLIREIPLPCIVPWRQRHFVVIYETDENEIHIADPAQGLLSYRHQDFVSGWTEIQDPSGFVLVLEPNTHFYTQNNIVENSKGFSFLWSYFSPYKKLINQIFLGLIVATIIQLLLPFFMQSVVDTGIAQQNIHFVYLVLISQLILVITQSAVGVFRDWLLIHITSRFQIKMVSDFLFKMLKLPINYFETRNTGEHLQRIQDHNRIQNFISSATLNMIFSIITFILFSGILFYYSYIIFAAFFIASILYVSWTFLFLKKRKELDFKRFDETSTNQTNLLQIIQGAKEIKINNSQRKNRWKWEYTQISLFKTALSSLKLQQYQSTGATLINELKNITITFLAAKLVIDGNLTLGMMTSIQYIVGQLNVPLGSFVAFIQIWQDAKISLERLLQVHSQDNEDLESLKKLKELPEDKTIHLKNITFQYGSKSSPLILKNINCSFPQGKTTAIVGSSGSGKTTLMKLLLKFYEPTEGEIYIGETSLHTLDNDFWRYYCGAVLQETFMFNDTIAGNISEAEQNEIIDRQRLKEATVTANLFDFVNNLPNKFNTELGTSGMRLSGGQEQRIMIARAVYKNPLYVFFDEATSALDANNEKVIMDNLNKFVSGKTAIIVAHRLSTVKNADNIIVLENGEIVEQGTHMKLTKLKGKYYELVKNQLELGN
jgi:ATP-binding cassette, subfamily B, bacterial